MTTLAPQKNSCFRSAGGFWLLIYAIINADVVRHPARHTTMPTYRLASTQWWAGQDPYSRDPHAGFLYFPQAASLFTPFNALPDLAGDLLWRAATFGLFAYALVRLNDFFLSLHRPPRGKTFLILSLLAVPSAFASLRNAQFDLPLAALIVLATAEIASARWTTTAVWLSLALALKPLAVVPLLLLGALYWKLIPRIFIGLLVVLALPFLHWSSAFVAHEYVRCFETLVWAAQANEPKYSDLAALFSHFGYDAPDVLKTVARVLFALNFLGLGAMAVRRLSRIEAAWAVGALSADYLMLFNPRTETCSYVFLGPFVASLALFYAPQPGRKWLSYSCGFAALGLACDAFPKIGGFSIHDVTDRWFKPLLALFFLPILIQFIFETRKCHAAPDDLRIHEVNETEFKATTEGKMTNVTTEPNALIDIWPYASKIGISLALPDAVIKNRLLEYVYRSQFDHYDHVLIPVGKQNVFLVIIVDRKHGSVFGHKLLNLNAEYGLSSDT